MVHIAFLLLAHKSPARLIEQATLLTARGDDVVIHYDRRAPKEEWQMLQRAAQDMPRVHLLPRRHRCGWGEWSLVAASLGMIREGLALVPEATHFYLISGDCWPIQPREALAQALAPGDMDLIETADFLGSNWIRTGIKEERLIYRFPFNEREQKRLFYWALDMQRRFGLRRSPPRGIPLRIGSQWWCLRRHTLERLMALLKERPELEKFFSLVWIPDECFFQSMVSALVPESERSGRAPTRGVFSDYGLPQVFYDDHAPLVAGQAQGWFVRKLAASATDLRAGLAERYLAQNVTQEVSTQPDLKRHYQEVASRGRRGRAAMPGPWCRAAPALTLVICKKWHVAQRVVEAAADATKRRALPMLFDQAGPQDPDLGGYCADPEARRADPLAYLDQVAEALRAHHLILPIDPCQHQVLAKLSRAGARLLWLDCAMDEAFVAGHTARIGSDAAAHALVAAELAGERSAVELLPGGPPPAIRADDPAPVAAAGLARALDIDGSVANDLAQRLELTGG